MKVALKSAEEFAFELIGPMQRLATADDGSEVVALIRARDEAVREHCARLCERMGLLISAAAIRDFGGKQS